MNRRKREKGIKFESERKKGKKRHLNRKDRAFTLMLETLSLVLNCSLERNLQSYNF
jgi:hypothetical protein